MQFKVNILIPLFIVIYWIKEKIVLFYWLRQKYSIGMHLDIYEPILVQT